MPMIPKGRKPVKKERLLKILPSKNPNIRIENNKKNLIKAILVSNVLLECFDDLEDAAFYRHKLKQTVKKAVVELEKFSDDVWDKMTNEKKKEHNLTQEKFSRSIDEILELIINK